MSNIWDFLPRPDGLLPALGKCIHAPPCTVILDLVAQLATCKQAFRGHVCAQVGLSSPAHSAMALVWVVGSTIERFCLQGRLTGLEVPDVSWCRAGPHRGPVPRGEQGGPGGWRGAEVEGLPRCSCWTGPDALPPGSSTELGRGGGVPWGALWCWGCFQTQKGRLRPRLQGHVGWCWALFLRTEQREGSIQAARRTVLPRVGEGAPCCTLLPGQSLQGRVTGREPLCQGSRPRKGGSQPGSPRPPQWRNEREEEVLDGDPDLGAFPLTSCHRFTAGGGRGWGRGGGEVDLPSIHVFECSSSRVRTSHQLVSEPEIHPPWMEPPALEVLGARDTSRLPLVSSVKWDGNCLVGIRMR